MNLSVVILPAKILADGSHKIRISIAHNGTTRYIPTRFTVPSVDCLKKGVVTNKVGNASYINQQIRSIQTKIYKAYDEIEDAECYSCSQLVQLINDNLHKVKPRSFDEISTEWLFVKNSTCSATTCELYKEGIASFKEFKGGDFLLALLTSKTVWEYDSYLAAKYKSDSTINIKMAALKGVVNLAVKRKYVSYDVDPFDEYQNRSNLIRECAIPVSVLRKIRDYHSDIFGLQRSADLFMLSFYMAGMNTADLLNLRFMDDSISFIRTKTERRRNDKLKTEFSIQPEARTIIDKYIRPDGSLDFGSPKFNDKKITKYGLIGDLNRKLKTIASEIDYDGKLIIYSARKTFSQIAFLHGIQERVIAYCIGDSTKKRNDVMSHYITANKQLADDAIRKVLDFVAGDKTERDLIG